MSKQTTGAVKQQSSMALRRRNLKAGPRESASPHIVQSDDQTHRALYTRLAKKNHPNITPKDDVHLYILAKNLSETPEERIANRAKLIRKPGETIKQARKRFCDRTTNFMNQRATVYGLKPESPDEEDVHYLPLPNSPLDIRVWGKGLAHVHMYCLDFIDRTTRKPINSPADFELWAVPQLNAWWLPSSTGRCQSADNAFGIASNKITPGDEKFCVSEGASYRLVRKGHKDVCFTVPRRPVPQPPPYWLENAEVHSFTPSMA
ncbi:hypothetical protein OF83DRAFT_1134254 [Amylostereum chailletii]|nr:hypothetical protein OF83DRAFT_1134254 [Amylostereum chailletii]